MILEFNPKKNLSPEQFEEAAAFLYQHLEQYGDKVEDIKKCMNYAMGKNNSPGGYVFQLVEDGKTKAITVINKTGMDGYIPENILVYIAADSAYRGKGLGKQLMSHAIENISGNIALHVEPDNPAKFLYEKLGFTNKYLEMRLEKK